MRSASERPLARLLPYLGRYRRSLVVGTAMVAVTNAVAAVTPWILGRAIDDLQLELTRDKLLQYALILVGLSLVEGIFRFCMRHVLIGMSRRVEYDLRGDLFSHLLRLDPAFYQGHTTGDLMSRSTNDLSAVRSVLGPGIMYSLNTLFTALLAVGLLLSIDPGLAVVSLLPLVGVSVCTRYFGAQIHRRFGKVQEQFAGLTSLVQENVAGVRVVKAYNQEAAFVQRFEEANRRYVVGNLGLARISGLFHPTLALLLGLSSVVLLGFGGWKVMQGQISLGDLVAFMAYVSMLSWPTIALGWVTNIVERGSASMRRINALLDSEPLVSSPELSAPPAISRGHLRVSGLTFSYNGSPVLEDVSFEVPAGQTLAIVGRTGSGKSTLATLLGRFRPVPRGRISIDGLDVNDLPLDVLRRSIAFVPQDTFLFSASLRDNIAFGKPGAGEEQIERVARISDIWPDVQDFPDRLDTFVGERGVTLSGGQKQRVAISRALLTEAPVLLLDDALSAVDTQTEERILQRLGEQLERRTAIVISHRISTVQSADQILVLEEGRVAERGTHRQLLEQEGIYRQLYERQLLQEELEVQ